MENLFITNKSSYLLKTTKTKKIILKKSNPYKKMLVIVQSRCSSKRFPNKALYPIKSVPLILRVLQNITKSRHVTDLIVSTSTDKSDDRLVRLLKFFKYNYYRGSLKNVALRLLKTALKKR